MALCRLATVQLNACQVGIRKKNVRSELAWEGKESFGCKCSCKPASSGLAGALDTRILEVVTLGSSRSAASVRTDWGAAAVIGCFDGLRGAMVLGLAWLDFATLGGLKSSCEPRRLCQSRSFHVYDGLWYFGLHCVTWIYMLPWASPDDLNSDTIPQRCT